MCATSHHLNRRKAYIDGVADEAVPHHSRASN